MGTPARGSVSWEQGPYSVNGKTVGTLAGGSVPCMEPVFVTDERLGYQGKDGTWGSTCRRGFSGVGYGVRPGVAVGVTLFLSDAALAAAAFFFLNSSSCNNPKRPQLSSPQLWFTVAYSICLSISLSLPSRPSHAPCLSPSPFLSI